MRQYLYVNRKPDTFIPILGALPAIPAAAPTFATIGAGAASLVSGLGNLIDPPGDVDRSSLPLALRYAGWERFKANNPPLPVYPPLAIMQQAFAGSVNAPAIAATYMPQDGSVMKKDWRGRVVALNPITIEWFLGDGIAGHSESGHDVERGTLSWIPPASNPVAAVAQSLGIGTGGGNAPGFALNGKTALFGAVAVVVAVVILWFVLRR